MHLHTLSLILLLAAPVSAEQGAGSAAPPAAQKPDPAPAKPQATAPAINPKDLPVDVDRIQKALANTPMLRFDEKSRPVFRVQVFGDKPTIEDILGPDWANGLVPYGGMTHQEFLKMVTPEDVQGYAAFSNKEGATVAATSFLLQWTLQKAIRKFQESRDDRERDAARKEVMDALNALEEARAKAGLPRK